MHTSKRVSQRHDITADRSVMVDYRMFPVKRAEDQSVSTEESSRPSQTQVAGSGVEQVTGTDDHSDTATYAADCGLENLDTSQQQRLEVKRPLTETKEELWREMHGLGREIREMMHGVGREIQQGIGREMSVMRHDVVREMQEMQRENGASLQEMRQEMCEMQKGMREEMCEMQKEMGPEISEMQMMRRETSAMQKEMGREMSEMQKGMREETNEMQKGMREEMSEMQKGMREEMSEMLQKVQDISTTASHAVISNLTSASGRSTEEGLQDVITHLTDTGTIVGFFVCYACYVPSTLK